jgi:hypothetical protein
MFLSTDYSYLRGSTWQSGLSREEVFRRFPDKRSWWIDSSGEVFDSGQDHDQFVKDHPELFDSNEIWTTYHAVRKFWVRVSSWGPSFTINSRNINQKQLDAAQILYMHEGEGKKVEFFQDNVIPTSFDKEEFLELKNVNQLKRMRNRFAASPSDYMKEKHTDKRSWWVDPQGKVYDVGHDHNSFLEKKSKIFGKWADINKALTMNWVRVAFWGGEYVVHCHYITRAQIAACQEIYKSLGGEYRIYISTLNKYGYISSHDFIWADSASDWIRNLFNDPAGIRSSGRRKAVGDDDRAWLISPDGQTINCGDSHEKFVLDNRDFFKKLGYNIDSSYLLVKDGWARLGVIGGISYIECNRLTDRYFNAIYDLTMEINPSSGVQVIVDGKTMEFTLEEFKQFNNKNQVLRYLLMSKRIGSLPKSRNFLLGVSLDSMSWPLRQAFDLLDLSHKKDKLSANQVTAVFQANDKFLQDNLGRTATELTRDLNAFFQYGSSKEQVI